VVNAELGHAIVGSLVLGSLYALVSIGFVILYRSTGVINFAQGSFMVLGGFIFYSLVATANLPWEFALLCTCAALGLSGAAVYVALLRRMVGAEPFVLVIASLGLSVVIETIIFMTWGPNTRTLPELVPVTPLVSIGNIKFSALDIITIAIAVVIIVALEVGLQHTRTGVRMRAVADGPLLASLMRVNVHVMSAIAWGIAAVCAGAAGAAYAMRTSLDPPGLQALGLVVFPAVLLGGLDSIRGALIGGLGLAIIQNAGILMFGGDWSDVVAYTVLLAVLLVRPRGLFGSRAIVRL
jgi:branched-chain amino acid transport system permease protein